jgi:aspartyl-tRNA(Asn)/glutamyl-tRNA(Gln) amidotransferase subunit A
MTPLHDLSISELAPRLAAREVSSLEVTEACLSRIATDNGRVNAFITVLGDEARQDARRADAEIAAGRRRGPLHGVPISLKDLIDLSGVPTTAASRVLDGHVARADAVVVARLREAGTVFLGKCNLHEFAFGTTSEDSAFGPVRNPWDGARSAGGSSGGSAAAVATGMGLASIGTDTGGSIRIPAAVCGCVGLKPTTGELPTGGIVPLSWTLDHVGPLARSVADAWLLFHAMAGTPNPAALALDRPSAGGLRLGLPRPYFLDILDDAVRAAFERACAQLTRAGVTVADRAVPHAADTGTVYLHLQLPEASAYHAPMLESHPELYTPPVRQRLEMGRYVMAEDYARAGVGARALTREVDAALEGVDALVLPTVPIVAPPLGKTSLVFGGAKHPVRALMLRLTQLFDVTGHPAITLPCARSADRLPVGLQLVGRRGRTAELLLLAAAIERELAGQD